MFAFIPALALVTINAACAAQAIPGLTRPTALPHASFDSWGSVGPKNYRAVVEACRLTDQQIEALLNSDDPMDRGLGIFLLDQRCDLRRLLQFRHLLDDETPSIPSSEMIIGMSVEEVMQGKHFSEPRTVKEYMRRALSRFLGERVEDQDQLDAVLARVEDPDLLANAWVERLKRSRTPEYLARPDVGGGHELPCVPLRVDVKAGIEALPPHIRWVVVCAVVPDDPNGQFYSEQEAAAVLARTAAEVGGKIDPDASPAWFQPGMSPTEYGWKRNRAIATLQHLAPDLITQP